MSLVLQSSGGGQITIQEPATASNFTLDLPASTGTVLTTTSPKVGNVIQVVQATTATQVTTATGPVDTGLSASITPTSATSKILVLVTQNFYLSAGGNDVGVIFDVFRGATKILAGGSQGFYLFAASASPEIGTNWNTNYLDSPATTSATTYKVQMTISASGGTVVANWTGNTSTIILMEIAA
jgi:hypothetical protein